MRNLPATLASSNQHNQTLPRHTLTASNSTQSPEPIAFAVGPGARRGASTDGIFQWPVFQDLLSHLPRFHFADADGSETYTYLNDLINQADPSAVGCANRLELMSNLSDPVSISTERADIEILVDRYFKRVNTKNPILSRRVINQYCQQYYEHGALFNLETCLVLLTCALGAISSEFNPLGQALSPHDGISRDYTQRPDPARVTGLRLGRCYFIAAEKRLGMAMSEPSTIAVQCLCLAGYVYSC